MDSARKKATRSSKSMPTSGLTTCRSGAGASTSRRPRSTPFPRVSACGKLNRMTAHRTVLITGAAGNLGGKLRRHLEGRYALRLLDRDPSGDPDVFAADLSQWDDRWVQHFAGADTVVHLAADPTAHQSW